MTNKSDIDGQAVNNDAADAPKKRARIVKRDTDHVYSASQHQGERFDSVSDERSHNRAAASKAKDDKVAVIHALESEVLVPPRKNRGRPSKAYLDAQRAYEEAVRRQQEQIAEARAALLGSVTAEAASVETVAEESEALKTAFASEEIPVKTPSVSTYDDDIPEFVRMQQAQMPAETEVIISEGIVDDDNKENDKIESKADVASADESEQSESVRPSEVQPIETKSETNVGGVDKALWNRLSEAYVGGQRFIIDEDIPVYSTDGIFSAPDVASSVLGAAKSLVGFGSNHSLAFSESAPATASAASAEARRRPAEGVSAAPVTYNQDIIIPAEGVLDIDPQGVGYLRSSDYNYMPSPDDIYVSQQLIRSNNLRHGDSVECKARAPKEGEKYYALTDVVSINGRRPIEVRDRIAFEHLTPLFPDEQFRLSKPGIKAALSCRIVDLFAPIGKGQRALIVAQPKTGKTILMKQIANAIAANYPDTYLMMLLIDERPEEVTDMARTVNAEVIASTFDEPAKRHVRIANLVLEKAKRMVECGRDVVIFLDSITRLARAFNTEAPASGKILTGGVDANALQRPKRFFGAARNIEGGGSLTIIATALIETGSKMDEVIFEEFKGTGNMELQLDRTLANKRIFPAVNLVQSSTRREDLLLDETTINRMFITRNFMADMSSIEAMNFIRKHLESTISNEEFITTIDK